MRFGYLVPEFPGQTHAFFWREIVEIERQGNSVDVISTKLPPSSVISHSWSAAARKRTTYLGRPSASAAVAALAVLVGGLFTGRTQRALRLFRGGGESKIAKAQILIAGVLLARHARHAGWKHIHVHSCASSAHIALVASRLSSVTYSLTLHGPLDDYGPRQHEKWSGATFALVITRQLLEQAKRELGASMPADVAVAPMGIRTEDMVRTRPYAAWDGHEDLRVFTCGRLNAAKGHDTLIRAVAQLRDQGIAASLVIAGEDEQGGGGYRRTLEALIVQLGVGPHVSMVGAVDEAAIRRLLSHAHVFTLASHGEPLGVAIMEAMAMGVPVVVGDGGGVRELIDDTTGILVDPALPESVAAGIRGIALDPQHAIAVAENAQRRVRTQFTSSASASALTSRVRAHSIDQRV